MLRLSNNLYLDPARIDGIAVHADGSSTAYPHGVHDPDLAWRLTPEQTQLLLEWYASRDDGVTTQAALEHAIETVLDEAEPALPSPTNVEPLGAYIGRVIDALNDAGMPNAAWLAARLEVLRRDAPAGVMWSPTGEVVPIGETGEILAITA